MLRRSRRRTRSTRSPYCGAGPWLEAAPDLPQYDGERQRRVFETLAGLAPGTSGARSASAEPQAHLRERHRGLEQNGERMSAQAPPVEITWESTGRSSTEALLAWLGWRAWIVRVVGLLLAIWVVGTAGGAGPMIVGVVEGLVLVSLPKWTAGSAAGCLAVSAAGS